jgi:hypothetical protein
MYSCIFKSQLAIVPPDMYACNVPSLNSHVAIVMPLGALIALVLPAC